MRRGRRVLHETKHQQLQIMVNMLINKDDPTLPWDSYPCFEWPHSRAKAGYGTLTVNYETLTTHRESYRIAYGNLGDDECVLHRCDNPPCIRPVHLFKGTKKTNNQDRADKGRTNSANNKRGSEHGMAKLTEAEVAEIRLALSNGVRGALLAKRYGVGDSTISRIKRGSHWTHVK